MNTRKAFTLIELLISMSIIAIMATMAIAVMFGAQESAKDRKTRATIAKLHTIVMEKWESYRTRRVPIDPLAVAKLRGLANASDATIAPMIAARVRLDALRELMRMEMPDGWRDVATSDASGVGPAPLVSGVPETSAYRAMFRAYCIESFTDTNKNGRYDNGEPYGDTNGNGQFDVATDEHERAECLFAMIMFASTDENNPIELFKTTEIGDVDKDGAREFIDGWGRPIRFLRWAPGFVSELQTRVPKDQPDTFDPRKVYPRPGQADVTFSLVPLIYSAGPDGEFDIYGGEASFAYHSANNNPFVGLVSPHMFPGGQIGTVVDLPSNGENNSIDNIHNHLVGSR